MAIALEELEVGLMFWGDTEPLKMIRAVKSLGIRCGHLGFTGAVPLAGLGAVYKQALAEEGFAVTAVFAAYDGESYADAPTVEQTVGFIPADTRAEREARTYEVIDETAAMGKGQTNSSVWGPPWAQPWRQRSATRPGTSCERAGLARAAG